MRRLAPLLPMLLCIAVNSASAAPAVVCAIDMGSNSFRRIVGSFADGRYVETRIESKTLGVGDDVARHGRISDLKLTEISETLAAFHASCQRDGAPGTVAVGTAAFRDAPNGRRVVELASRLGVKMEIATEQRESELAYLVGSLGRDGYAVIDNGSRSIELVARVRGATEFVVFNLGYRIAYEEFFANATDPAVAVAAFRDRLLQEAAKAPFMKGRSALIGVEFQEMAEALFDPAPIEGHRFTSSVLKRRLDQIVASPREFAALKNRRNIDRALPRLVTAVALTDAFGYPAIELTTRQLGVGLIIEAGLRR